MRVALDLVRQLYGNPGERNLEQVYVRITFRKGKHIKGGASNFCIVLASVQHLVKLRKITQPIAPGLPTRFLGHAHKTTVLHE